VHQAASEHAAKEANAAGERGAKLQRELAEQVCPSCNSRELLTLLCLVLFILCYDYAMQDSSAEVFASSALVAQSAWSCFSKQLLDQCGMRQVHTNTQLLAENSQKAVALRLGEDAMSRVRSEAAKAWPDRQL